MFHGDAYAVPTRYTSVRFFKFARTYCVRDLYPYLYENHPTPGVYVEY